jgi:hypothetical protein
VNELWKEIRRLSEIVSEVGSSGIWHRRIAQYIDSKTTTEFSKLDLK